jgi:hypothetical protein
MPNVPFNPPIPHNHSVEELDRAGPAKKSGSSAPENGAHRVGSSNMGIAVIMTCEAGAKTGKVKGAGLMLEKKGGCNS